MLMESVLHELQTMQFQKVYLWVLETNDKARRFDSSLDFVDSKERSRILRVRSSMKSDMFMSSRRIPIHQPAQLNQTVFPSLTRMANFTVLVNPTAEVNCSTAGKTKENPAEPGVKRRISWGN